MAMFVSRLPVGMSRPEMEKIHVREAASDRPRRRDWITKRSLLTEYKY